MLLKTLLASLALLGLSVGSHISVADAKPKKRALKDADAHFKRGVGLVDEGNFAPALEEFEKAYALAPHPLVLFNIAGAHRALKHYREALDTYSRFLLEGDGVVNSAMLARAKLDMEELLALLGRVELDSNPRGAQVFVDGVDMGTTPISERLILTPGAHEIEARLDGHKSVTRSVRVSSGDELSVLLELTSLSSGTEATGPEETTVSVKGVRSGPPAPRRFSLSAAFGTNTLQIGTTGAPTLGAGINLSDRLSFGLDVVLVAYSAIPQLRFRVVGDALSVHLIAAVPLNVSGSGDSEFFVAGAGGAGVRYAVLDNVGLRLEALVSYAGSERGLTVPAFAGAEVFF